MNDHYNSTGNKPSSQLTPEEQWKQMQLQFDAQQKRHQKNVELQQQEQIKRQQFLNKQPTYRDNSESHDYWSAPSSRQAARDYRQPTDSRQVSRDYRQPNDSRQVSRDYRQPNDSRQISRDYNREGNLTQAKPRTSRAKRRRQQYYRVLFFRFLFFILIPVLFLTGIISLGVRLFGQKEEVEVEVATTTPTTTIEPAVEEDTTISFLAVGDNLIHERIYVYADEMSGVADDGLYDFTSCYEYMADTIAAADISFINQESIIGGDELGLYGYPAFNSPEQVAEDLVNLGFDMVNGATNHSLDMGSAGVENTAEIWRQYEDDVLFSGIYDSQEDADTIRIMEQDGVTFALLSYTYGVNDYTMPNDYCVSLFDEDKIREDVANAKAISDVVIVSAHWGTESSYEVTDEQRAYAQLFADLEVDLVIGHHPHVIQSMEWVEGENGNQTLVAYSLGNFFSTMETVDTQLEGMLTLDFVVGDDNEVTIENVAWTQLINHFDEEVFFVLPLSEYTDELNATHYVLAEDCPDAVTTFTEMTYDIIGSEFTIY